MSTIGIWRRVTRGLAGLMRGADAERDLRDEVAQYVEAAAAAQRARGLSPEDAMRAARLEVGNVTGVRERVRMSLWENVLTNWLGDVRYAVRRLRRSPVFALVVVLVIAIGTAAVTTIFSGVNAFLLRPVPGVRDPGSLYAIRRVERGSISGTQASRPLVAMFRDDARTLSGIAAFGRLDATISTGGVGVSANANLVTGNFFDVLGVRPMLGRFFLPSEDSVPLAHPVIVVSYGFWRRALGADSALVGTTLQVNGHPFTLIGVTPPGFQGVQVPIVTDAWVPTMMQPLLRPPSRLDDAGSSWLWEVARIRPGVSREAVHADLSALLAARIESGVEPKWLARDDDIRLVPFTGLPEDARRVMRTFTGVLLGVAFLVLLIASVNVAALLSARAVARRHEMAVRLALGARRSRIVMQLLTETGVLFALGAGAGMALTFTATRALQQISLPSFIVPLALDLTPDWRVLGFGVSVALVMGVVFGLAPALRASRQDVSPRLRNDVPGGGSRRTIVNRVLVVGQLAVSLLLIVAAGLMLRALLHASRVDPGFDSTGVVTAELKPRSWGYDEARQREFFRTLRDRLAADPRVAVVAFTDLLPLQLSTKEGRVRFDGTPVPSDGSDPGVDVHLQDVSEGYFDALRMPLVAGRGFRRADDASAPRVAVINQTFARRAWPEGGALGRTFVYEGQRVTVVGVARDAKYTSLTETTPMFLFLPIAQEWPPRQTLMVRARDAAGAPALAGAISRAVHDIDPEAPRPEVVTMRQATSFVLLPQRVAALVAGSLGLTGLLLAAVGLYGVIAYSVGRRARELGVRMALGASASRVQWMVVREGLTLALTGVAIGLVMAAAASRLLVSFLYGVSPLDAVTFVGMSAVLTGVAAIASFLPARRAARADPVAALRME